MGLMHRFDRPGFPLPCTGLLTHIQMHEIGSKADSMLK